MEAKKYLVTGATGFIGSALVKELAASGHSVNALVRDLNKGRSLAHENVTLFRGDILDYGSVLKAAEGCYGLFHTAAFTRVSGSDEEIYDLNVRGTEIVLRASADAGIKNVVFTSTAGVLGPSDGKDVNEESVRSVPYFIKYEETKALAEETALTFSGKGMNIMIVNPTRVYGPGPLSGSNSVTMMVCRYSEGRWRILPGNGRSIGNYVWLDDVVRGHLLAMEKGRNCERYILGGENADFNTLFGIVSSLTGKKHILLPLPSFLMILAAYLAVLFSSVTGKPPLITPGLARRYLFDWKLSSGKAREELGYSPVSLAEGIKRTLEWYTGIKAAK